MLVNIMTVLRIVIIIFSVVVIYSQIINKNEKQPKLAIIIFIVGSVTFFTHSMSLPANIIKYLLLMLVVINELDIIEKIKQSQVEKNDSQIKK